RPGQVNLQAHIVIGDPVAQPLNSVAQSAWTFQIIPPTVRPLDLPAPLTLAVGDEVAPRFRFGLWKDVWYGIDGGWQQEAIPDEVPGLALDMESQARFQADAVFASTSVSFAGIDRQAFNPQGFEIGPHRTVPYDVILWRDVGSDAISFITP